MIDEDDIVRSSLADDLAALTRLYPTPAAPFGFGTDLSLGDDVTETLEEVNPFSMLGVGQAVARCWDCPRGALPPDGTDAQDYGIDLRSYCNKGVRLQDVRALESRLENEALKDDRVSRIKVKVTVAGSGAKYTITVNASITAQDPTLGTFALVLAATTSEVIILAIGGAQ